MEMYVASTVGRLYIAVNLLQTLCQNRLAMPEFTADAPRLALTSKPWKNLHVTEVKYCAVEGGVGPQGYGSTYCIKLIILTRLDLVVLQWVTHKVSHSNWYG